MDELDHIIREKRRRLARLKRLADSATKAFYDAQLQLSALEHAASVRPSATCSATIKQQDTQEQIGPRRGGRQYGAVSQKWRAVLASWVMRGNYPMQDDDLCRAARADLGLAPASVRQRVRRFCDQGYLELGANGYRVTDMAISKFGFPAPEGASPENDEAQTHH